MKHPQISAKLEHIYGYVVRLTFTNTSDRPAALYRYNACAAGQIENDVFVIKEGDKVAAYTGRYVKRAAPSAEDFDPLPAHTVRTVDVDLLRAYKLVAGVRYAVVYEALHDDPTRSSKALWLVTSPICAVKA